jgi:hypothetical protein
MDPESQLVAALDARQLETVLAEIGVRLDSEGLQNVLAGMAHTRMYLYGDDRLDANETALFGRQLEAISNLAREVRRPELKWRQFIPVTTEAPPGAETWAYYLWDAFGMAEIVANYADDIRRVAITAQKVAFDIETYALGYDYSVLDIERAAMAGVNYRNRKSDAVRRGFELRFEKIAAFGQPGTSIRGLLNNPNVPLVLPKSVGGGTIWGAGTKTPADVLDDLLAHEDAILIATKGVERPNTLLLSLDKFRYIQKTALFTGAGSDPKVTILSAFLERSASVTDVDWWLPLAKADSAGTGPRNIMYARDPQHVHMEMPLAPTELPPQAHNLALEVNSWCRNGGVAFEYPLSAAYMDGI